MAAAPSSAPTPHRVAIAGGGVAAVETALALRALAGASVELTMVAPNDDLRYRPLAVAEAFGRPSPRRYPLDRICRDLDIRLLSHALHEVDGAAHALGTDAGTWVGYDSLVLAIGARPRRTLPHAHTFMDVDVESLRWLLRHATDGRMRRLAFVVPAATGWSLPLYELALMTAARAKELGVVDLELTIVTPEDVPLAAFRGAGSDAVAALLAEAGIAILTSTYARDYDGHALALAPGDRALAVERVVTLPMLTGPAIKGVPADPDGFVHVDEDGRVPGVPGVFAVGDATTFPIRQGGLAAQQADVVATLVARAAGLVLPGSHARPRLRAVLLTGGDPLYLRATISGGESVASSASRTCPWWPPHKIAARHLAPYLADLEQADPLTAQHSAHV